MTLFIKHPRTGKADTMLTLAVAGFLVSAIALTAGMVIAWLKRDMSGLTSLAALIASILTPTVSAYTIRKYSDFKNGSGTHEDAPDVGDEQN